jgi:FkbM family methyltransferase
MAVLLHILNRMPASWIRAAGALRGRSALLKRMTDWLPGLLRNQDGCIQKGLGRGLRFNGGQSAVGFILGTHDLDVQYAMSRLIQPGMTVYDIGANVGFTAILAANQVTASGRVICFEPLAVNATAIRHNAQLNGFAHVEVVQTALGIADGEAEFFVSASPTWGRLAQAGEAPMQTGVVRVPVRTLDSLSAQWPMPQFIKMDVEGVEADVIRGGGETLRRARPIMVIELHHTYHAVMDALKGLDYAVQPLTEAGNVPSLDGELQIIAYPPERREVESICADLLQGRMAFP